MLANREEGARHLSSNKGVHHYVARPAENMDKHIGDYRVKIEEGESAFEVSCKIVLSSPSTFFEGTLYNRTESVASRLCSTCETSCARLEDD
jgi:hypothetical protein